MDNYFNQASGYKLYNTPPCPACAQPSQMGQRTQMQQPQQQQQQSQQQMQTRQTLLPGTDVFNPFPTGLPQGPQYGPPLVQQQGMIPQQQGLVPTAPSDLAPIVPWNQPIPVTTESLQYMNGFMRTQIGRKVSVEFLIGTNTLTDKTGTLLAVGANYILINEVESDDILLCDFYSIKFMKFFY